MDEFTREGLAIRVGRSFKATEVKEILREIGAKHGYPPFMRSDNGSEFIAGTIKEFLAENNVKAAYIEPGSPWQNGKGESFNGKFRDECLRMEIFGNIKEAVVIAEQWRKFYNSERPHSSLNYQTPDEFKRDWEKRQKLLKNEMRRKLAMPMAQGVGSVQFLGQMKKIMNNSLKKQIFVKFQLKLKFRLLSVNFLNSYLYEKQNQNLQNVWEQRIQPDLIVAPKARQNQGVGS